MPDRRNRWRYITRLPQRRMLIPERTIRRASGGNLWWEAEGRRGRYRRYVYVRLDRPAKRAALKRRRQAIKKQRNCGQHRRISRPFMAQLSLLAVVEKMIAAYLELVFKSTGVPKVLLK